MSRAPLADRARDVARGSVRYIDVVERAVDPERRRRETVQSTVGTSKEQLLLAVAQPTNFGRNRLRVDHTLEHTSVHSAECRRITGDHVCTLVAEIVAQRCRRRDRLAQQREEAARETGLQHTHLSKKQFAGSLPHCVHNDLRKPLRWRSWLAFADPVFLLLCLLLLLALLFVVILGGGRRRLALFKGLSCSVVQGFVLLGGSGGCLLLLFLLLVVLLMLLVFLLLFLLLLLLLLLLPLLLCLEDALRGNGDEHLTLLQRHLHRGASRRSGGLRAAGGCVGAHPEPVSMKSLGACMPQLQGILMIPTLLAALFPLFPLEMHTCGGWSKTLFEQALALTLLLLELLVIAQVFSEQKKNLKVHHRRLFQSV
mmetsp:Transcript_42795/g.108013  ORF Transcript_42795/g.108013 Transcript_42795/m.108013 type:complete len:369 (+) Transcript_42795:513-1619(+)